jgi:multiple sugar transport system substrate-binding protein
MFHLSKKTASQLAIAPFVVLMVALSGCGAQATPTATLPPNTPAPQQATSTPTLVPPTATPAPVTMAVTWWGSQARHDATIKVINMFQTAYPYISITYDFSSFPDYWTMNTTKAAGGNLPCVMQQDYAYYLQYIKDGLIIPLDPYIADGTIDLSKVSPDAISGGKGADGKLYALSLGTNSQSFVLDTDLFTKAGIAIPKPDWTWKDFEDINNELHTKLGIYGNAGTMDQPTIVNIFMNAVYLSLGSGLFANDGKSLGFTATNSQPMVDLFSMLVRLQDAKAMPSHAEEAANLPTLQNNAFVSGKAAMIFAHTNQVVALMTAAGADRHVVLLPVPRPVGSTKPAVYFKPSMFFSISSQCKSPKEAAMFINYFTNSVDANKILMAERGVPISSAVADALKANLTPAQVLGFDFLTSLVGNVSPIRPPDPAANNDIATNVLGPLVMDPMMLHKITPEKAVEVYLTEANKLLAK